MRCHRKARCHRSRSPLCFGLPPKRKQQKDRCTMSIGTIVHLHLGSGYQEWLMIIPNKAGMSPRHPQTIPIIISSSANFKEYSSHCSTVSAPNSSMPVGKLLLSALANRANAIRQQLALALMAALMVIMLHCKPCARSRFISGGLIRDWDEIWTYVHKHRIVDIYIYNVGYWLV